MNSTSAQITGDCQTQRSDSLFEKTALALMSVKQNKFAFGIGHRQRQSRETTTAAKIQHPVPTKQRGNAQTVQNVSRPQPVNVLS